MTIDPRDAKFHQRPPMLAVDGNGYVWRVFEEHGGVYWSMCPVDSGNEPSPEPITYYVPVEYESATLLAAALAGDGGGVTVTQKCEPTLAEIVSVFIVKARDEYGLGRWRRDELPLLDEMARLARRDLDALAMREHAAARPTPPSDMSARWWALSQEEQDAINAEKKARGEFPIPTHRHRQIGRMRNRAATFTKPDGSPLITFEGDDGPLAGDGGGA